MGFFDIVDREEILMEISSLDPTKECQKSDIHTKIIKENANIFKKLFVTRLLFQSMKEPFHHFSNWLMLPSNFKKGFKNSIDDYRPISILKYLSKVFEKIMHKQMVIFRDEYFSKFQCGFIKSFLTSYL